METQHHTGTKWVEKAGDRGAWSQMEEGYTFMAKSDDTKDKLISFESSFYYQCQVFAGTLLVSWSEPGVCRNCLPSLSVFPRVRH